MGTKLDSNELPFEVLKTLDWVINFKIQCLTKQIVIYPLLKLAFNFAISVFVQNELLLYILVFIQVYIEI